MIYLFRLQCFLLGHQWMPCEWTARGVWTKACCLRCFAEKDNPGYAQHARTPTSAT